MRKKIFISLIVLMVVAVVGIIAVQVFWINNSIDIGEKQFEANVKSALVDVSKNIQQREFRDFVEDKRDFFLHAQAKAESQDLRTYTFQKIDTINNEIFTYKQSTLIDNHAIPASKILDNHSISKDKKVNFKTYFLKKEKEISSLNLNINKDLGQRKKNIKVTSVSELPEITKLDIENFYKEIAPKTPIYKRVTIKELQLNLQNELSSRGIETPFEFAVFAGEFPTKLRSENYKKEKGSTYPIEIFENDLGLTNYYLHVTFPDKKEYILSNIIPILILASTFILFIIIAFGGALHQMFKQKQISEIKTDFINNMTHEFKTPIATINLAIDAIKNPKIIANKEKVLRYTEMIREENKRMHAQVENVLRISKLEKNQLEIRKEVVDVHDIIENAISHVELIVKNKGGFIHKHFNAALAEILGSDLHLTNVIVNMLDNAIKYAKETPKISIYTENAGNFILIKIKDQGIGMTKNAQKHVFDKFYREQKGNIHNVKGHGLGLAYVKRIVESHQGTVAVESEKDKGSTFTIKLPLI